MSGIAERLKQTRKALGFTQAELASRVGVSQSAIGNIEAGLRERPRELLSIADVLGVDPNWLETGKNREKQHDIQDIVIAPIMRQQRDTDLLRSLKRVSSALLHADDLTLDQVRPLLTRLVDTPERNTEIVPRLHALLAQPA